MLAVTGVVLIISALLLFFHNLQEDQHAGDQSQWVLEEMRQLEDNEADTSLPASTTAPTEVLPAEMPTVHINGYDYIGTLSVPSLELELPVMAQWDYDRLKIAPCRQFGSSRTDDLVIVAHNYQNHFGRLKELSRGNTVVFTDMESIVNAYSVEKVETLAPTEIDAVQNSGYDLVLYTCTIGGKTRVAVFCNREQPAKKTRAADGCLAQRFKNLFISAYKIKAPAPPFRQRWCRHQ